MLGYAILIRFNPDAFEKKDSFNKDYVIYAIEQHLDDYGFNEHHGEFHLGKDVSPFDVVYVLKRINGVLPWFKEYVSSVHMLRIDEMHDIPLYTIMQ